MQKPPNEIRNTTTSNSWLRDWTKKRKKAQPASLKSSCEGNIQLLLFQRVSLRTAEVYPRCGQTAVAEQQLRYTLAVEEAQKQLSNSGGSPRC